MLLTGHDISVELRLIGWEAELEAGDRRDTTDWLDIEGVVTDASGTRAYHVSLDVDDAVRVASWLRDAAAEMPPSGEGQNEDALLSFVEPGFAVELMSRDQLTAVTHWYFHDPDGQELELLAFNARVISISCTRAELVASADVWADELALLLAA